MLKQSGDRSGDESEGGLELRLTGNLAADVAIEPADKRMHATHFMQRLFMATDVNQS